jgi:hypothetical protein
MATQESTLVFTAKAAGDLSSAQYLFQKLSAAKTVTTCAGTTDKSVGVLQNDPGAAGLPAVVAFAGTSKVVAGAAISVGALVAPMASGKAQTSASTQYARGIALEAAGADGDIIEILLIPMTVAA